METDINWGGKCLAIIGPVGIEDMFPSLSGIIPTQTTCMVLLKTADI